MAAYAGTLPPVRPTTGKFAGREISVRISKARLLDIILWSDVAIHDERHQGWSRWYAEVVAAESRG